MGRWWLLVTALALWLAGGYALRSPAGDRQTSAPAPQSSSQGRALHETGAGPRAPAPARIVALAPNLTEILFALGLGEKVVGVTQDSDYPPAASTRPRIGTFWQPDIESIIAARPDLVVTLAFEQQRDLARRLGRIGYECLVVNLETVADLRAAIAAVGAAAGAQARAGQLLDAMAAAGRRLQETTAGRPRVKVLWVVQREPLRVAGRDTFINEMIELAGGENAIGPTLHKYPPISAEQVLATGPEVIIEPAMVGDDLDGQRRQAVAYWRRYASVPAVAGGRIYVLDGALVSRLGPRLFAGAETIARCLWPPSARE